jgi:uncharacterized protein YndB with AHSA1/START domain
MLGMTQGSCIRCEVTIAAPVAVVYDYVTTPAHWPEWHPSSMRVTGPAAGHSLEVGEECTEEFLVAGHRGVTGWTCRERVPEKRWMIEASMERGGTGTITYDFERAGAGTQFTRTFRYAMPNFAYEILNVLVIRRRIAAESDRATAGLKKVLEARVARTEPGA